MKQYLIYGAIIFGIIVLLFGYGEYQGIGREVADSETADFTPARDPQIDVDQQEQGTIVKNCATISCSYGHTCTLKDQYYQCVRTETLSPPPPTETLEESGEWFIDVKAWDFGQSGYTTGSIQQPPRQANDYIYTYGFIQVPYSGNYVLETGFEPLALAMFQATKSACDNNPYYSGVKVNLVAGKKYDYQFRVKLPASAGIYKQYSAIFSGCASEGGEFISGKWRSIIVK